MIIVFRLVAIIAVAAAMAAVQDRGGRSLFGGRSLLHAHNAYPEKGRWPDRIDRALGTDIRPIVIEQDVALARRGGEAMSVVSHDNELTGGEPSLEEYFFKRVTPIMDAALAANDRRQWPIVVLHLDFKSNEPEHHRAVWRLLERHQRWLTTAPKHPAGAPPSPFTVGPMVVLTENGDGQAASFFDSVPADGRLLIFGSVAAPDATRIEDPDVRARTLARMSPAELVAGRPDSYRRWANFSWAVVEEGGQARAGEWTSADRSRLGALVDRAHALGLWIRFYTINGHAPAAHPEWTASYNFGSEAAARLRWQAAIDAGVDLIATDQYEELAALLRPGSRPRAQ
jgi:hypothetical protein